MGDNSFDEMFDDGLFRSNLRNTHFERPAMWPKSVSVVRRHTLFGEQGRHGHLASREFAPRAGGVGAPAPSAAPWAHEMRSRSHELRLWGGGPRAGAHLPSRCRTRSSSFFAWSASLRMFSLRPRTAPSSVCSASSAPTSGRAKIRSTFP